jgi:membrane-bound lytic murein transglycosylase B
MHPFRLLSALFLLLPLAAPAQPPQPAGQELVAAAKGSRGAQRAKSPPQREGPRYAEREEAMRFAEDVAARRDIDPEWTRRVLGQAQNLAVVSRLMQPAPATVAKNWAVYRSRFIDPIRIRAGVRFWEEHRRTLDAVERQYGVPAEIIVGIVGVETIYGQQMGDFRVLDALATLAFDFPASHPRAAERAQYFRGELEQFLAFHHAARSNPAKPLGSYAGAWGMPQFMPTSVARWGVDHDGDKKVDLVNSADDVIASVANYFKGFGWNTGMPTHYPVRFDREKLDLDALLAPDILPTFSVASFQAKGAVLEGPALEHKGPLALIELQNGGDPPTYVAGTENFYVITRYNWSSYYAMAVIELGSEVKEALGRQQAAGTR